MIKVNRRHGPSSTCDECNDRPPIFTVQIGRTVMAMCKICLKDLKTKAAWAIKGYAKFLKDKFQFNRAQK